MKKVLSLVLMGILAVALLAGCSTESANSTSTSGGTPPVEEKTVASNDLGNCVVEIKDYAIGKDQLSDAKVIMVTFGFTNNFEDNQSFGNAISPHAFQNGIELEYAYAEGEDDTRNTLLQPGASTNATLSWILQNTTDSVDVEITESCSNGTQKATKTFNLQ